MKTQNTKLNFRKDSIIELNEIHLYDVNGGGTPIALSSAPCGAAAGSLVMAVADYFNVTTF